jgi:RNA polymerase sigma-B factor
MPMVHRLARAYPGHEHADDIVQVAALGLAKAIDRYDPERGVPLRGYAVPTITGEIRRYRRDHCWAVRPPRTLQELVLKVTRCVDRLAGETGRPPSPAEVAAELGETPEAVVEALVAGRSYLADSLDAPASRRGDDDAATLGESVGTVEGGYDRTEHAALMDSLRDVLVDDDWTLLRLRFASDWTQEEIGRLLGVSQMTVSRRQRAALSRLRDRIGGDALLVDELGLGRATAA